MAEQRYGPSSILAQQASQLGINMAKTRTPLGTAATQITSSAISIRNGLQSLRSRLIGEVTPSQMIDVPRSGEPNVVPTIAESLESTLDLLAECHRIMEHLHKEVSLG